MVFFLDGILFAFMHAFHKKKLFPNKPGLSQDLFITGWLVVPVVTAILFHSTLYDGWRHFYFLWPAMVYVAIYGINSCVNYFNRHGVMWIRQAGIPAIFLIIGSAVFWNIVTLIRHHPHQYCYFNAIARTLQRTLNWIIGIILSRCTGKPCQERFFGYPGCQGS